MFLWRDINSYLFNSIKAVEMLGKNKILNANKRMLSIHNH